ncbi:hypothetical protein [Streptomyces sp. NPDC088755]|uniref:hypothetical protein n=1 Tax=Streptomyces sp. NPDC088755 TaxID=3365888 RepID=UPI00380FCC01
MAGILRLNLHCCRKAVFKWRDSFLGGLSGQSLRPEISTASNPINKVGTTDTTAAHLPAVVRTGLDGDQRAMAQQEALTDQQSVRASWRSE